MYIEESKKRSKNNFKIMLFYITLSQILIFFRSKLVAQNMAEFYDLEIYTSAIFAAGYVANLLSQGLLTVLLPVFHDIARDRGDEGRIEFVNKLVNLLIVVSLVLILVGEIFAVGIVKIFNKGIGGENLTSIVKLFRLALPMIIFILTRTVYLAFLQSRQAFKSGTKGAMAMNASYFFYLLLFSKLGLAGYVIGTVLAHASYYLVIPSIARAHGYKYEKILDGKDPAYRELLTLLIAMIVYILVTGTSGRINGLVLSGQKELYGTMANANYILGLVFTFLVGIIITITYPMLSEAYANDQRDYYKIILNDVIRIVTRILLPVSLIFILLPKGVTELFFSQEPGLFFRKTVSGPEEMEALIEAVRYLGISGLFLGLNSLFAKTFFSQKDFITPILVSFIGLGVSYFLGNSLVISMGEAGLVLATSIASIVMAIFFMAKLKKDDLLDLGRFLKGSFRSLVIALLMSGLLYIVYSGFDSGFSGMLVGLIVFAYGYHSLYGKVNKDII